MIHKAAMALVQGYYGGTPIGLVSTIPEKTSSPFLNCLEPALNLDPPSTQFTFVLYAVVTLSLAFLIYTRCSALYCTVSVVAYLILVSLFLHSLVGGTGH